MTEDRLEPWLLFVVVTEEDSFAYFLARGGSWDLNISMAQMFRSKEEAALEVERLRIGRVAEIEMRLRYVS